jgi:membrane protease YdiL (CAAX protease family)
MFGKLKKYLNKTSDYSPGRFILEMFLIISLMQVLFTVGPQLIENVLNVSLHVHFDDRENLINRYHWITAFLIACIFVPFAETILAQAIPITILGKITGNITLLLIVSALFFTFLHRSYPPLYQFYIFLTGLVYAWSFITYKGKGCLSALLITTIIHGLANLFPYLHIQFY